VAFTPVQKLSITTGAAMTLLGAVGLVAYLSTSQLVDAQNAAAHTNETINRLDRILVQTTAAENAVRAFVISGDASARAMVDSAQGEVESALDSLRVATEDHPDQRQLLDTLGPIVGTQFSHIRRAILVRLKVSRDSATALLRSGPMARRQSPARIISAMRNEEVRVLGERTRSMAERGKSSRMFIIAGSLFAFLLALVALQPLRESVGRRLTQRLTQSFSATPDDDVKG
jgi:CHASE3 domain sensor protein